MKKMLLQVKLGTVTLFGLFCISLMLDSVQVVIFPSYSFSLCFCGKRSMLCDGPSAQTVGSFLPICLCRQARSHSVFFEGQWAFSDNNKKEGLRKRALVTEMWNQNVKAIDVWDSIPKQWKLLSAIIRGQDLKCWSSFRKANLRVWVDLQFSAEWHRVIE